MIVAQLKDVLNSMPILKKLSEQQMPALTAFKIMKIIKATDSQFEDFNKTKIGLVEQYGTRGEDDNFLVDDDKLLTSLADFSNTNKELYIEELQGVLEEQIDIVAQPLTLKDIENLNLSPTEIMRLDCFIKEESPSL